MEGTLGCIGWILIGIAVFLGAVLLVKILWNWLLPNIMNVKKITFIQAFGLLLLAKILFGGFGYGRHHWGGWGHHGGHHKCEYREGKCMEEKKSE